MPAIKEKSSFLLSVELVYDVFSDKISFPKECIFSQVKGLNQKGISLQMQYDFDKFTISYVLLFYEKNVIKRNKSNIPYFIIRVEKSKEKIL